MAVRWKCLSGGWRAFALLVCVGVLAATAHAGPCELRAGDASTDLAACLSEPPASGGLRHLWIDVSWAGPGIAHRVLDLRLPDNFPLEARLRGLDVRGIPADGRARVLQVLGTDSPYAQRRLPSPRVALAIDFPPGRQRIELDYHLHLDGRLYPLLEVESAWRQRTSFDDMFSGLLWGVFATSMLVVLMSRLLARDSGAKSYALLVTIHGLGLAQFRGDLFAYLWPDAPAFDQVIALWTVALVLGCHAWFATQFLRLRERAPRLYRLHLAVMALFALAMVLPIEPAAIALGALAAAYSALALFTAGRTWRGGTTDLRLYTLGTSAHVLLSFVLFLACAAGHNPWPRFDHFKLPEAGYLLETVFFGAALYWRVGEARAREDEARLQQVRDALALVDAEKARQAANERALRSNLLFASVGHDLAQPLTSVGLALGALTLPEGQAPIAEHLHRTIAYAQTLLRDVLAQARGENATHEERFVLGDCIGRVVREHRASAAAKGLTLSFVDCQVEIEVSAVLLERVMNNLVSNAVRYTSRGRVLVGARRRAGGVELQVLDTGPGLAAGRLAQLERPFTQGESAAPEGHGLGLFIVRTLCDQAGLRLRVASRPGCGSALCVWIPAARA